MAAAAAEQQTPERADELRAAYAETVPHADDLQHITTMRMRLPLHDHGAVGQWAGVRTSRGSSFCARARESNRFTGTPQVGMPPETLNEHKAIVEAIVSGDPVDASAAR